MKYLAWFGGVVVTLVAVVYTLAFTSLGNGILSPTIESKIKEQTKLDTKLKSFKLNMSEIDVIIELNTNNTLHVDGTYDLFAQSFNLNYDVKLHELKTLKPLVGTPLNGKFDTKGNARGDMKFLQVNGKSDVASSDTNYHVELTDLNPTSIIAKVQNLKLEKLLDIAAQKKYASADVNLDINFKSIKTHALDGDITLKTKNGRINSKVMKNDFNLSIPKTAFAMNLAANLKGDEVKYDYKLLSNLFKITSSGDMTPSPLSTNIKYEVSIKELALLKPMTGADVRGGINLNGTLKGSKEQMMLKAKSDVAYSKTSLEVIMKNFAPKSVKADIKNLRLAKILKMLKQPHYADGVLALHVDISDARTTKLKGIVKSSIKHGLVDSSYMTKTYEFKSKMPKTTFALNTTTILDGNIASSIVDLDSSLLDLDIKKANFNISTASLKSDYIAIIPSLEKLFFATQQHMRGGLVVNGDLSKAKDLDLTIHTKVASGKIDAKLHNDDFHADLKSVDTMGLLHMLKYPELFKAKLNAKVDYNLADSKGVVDGHLLNGHFVKNQTFDLIKQYARFDMYKENFKGDISANINKEKIIASLDLKSNSSSIKTKNTKLNTKTQQIDSRLTIVANKNPIDTHITGNINKPKVQIDLEKFMKSEAGTKVKKELNRFFKKLF